MNTLLIVEDEKLIRQGIRAIAQRAPVKIETILEAKNGEEALDILRRQPVDVMLTDIRMPKMDGITLVERLREFPNPPLAVVISGFDDFSYAVNALRLGVKDYILKPIEREKIYEILVRLEDEVKQKEKAKRDKISIGQQVLRSLLLDANIGTSELDAIVAQYGGMFFTEPFVALCVRGADDSSPQDEEILCLKDTEGRDVYIARETAVPPILNGGLRGRCAGISNVHSGLGSLRQAYWEASAARGWAFTMGKAMRFSELPAEPEKNDIQKQLDMIVQLLGASNANESKKIMGQLLLWAQNGQLAPEDFIPAMEQLVSKITAAYRMVLPEENSLARFGSICGFENAFEYHNEFCAWIDGFCERLSEEFEDYQNKQKIMQAVQYIQNNFHNPLNMATASNEVNMNYSLFSYLFKQYTGTNFVNYLQNLRLEESKRLLANTDLKIIEISMQVGFQTEKHFMKLFKVTYGISPGEYRKNQRFSRDSSGQA